MTPEAQRPRSIPGLSPFRTYVAPAVIGGLAVVAELSGEPGRMLLRYQREALASGQIWRLVTGHLVHLGPSHMLMNVAALAILALLFGQLLRPRDWFAAGLMGSLAIDGGLYWLSPEVAWYVGLSGVLHGFWAAACLHALRRRTGEGLMLTGLILLKLGYEALIGPVPLTGAIASGPVVEIAHAYGAIGGVVSVLLIAAVDAFRRRL